MLRVRERKKTSESGRDRTKKGILAFQEKKRVGYLPHFKFVIKGSQVFLPSSTSKKK